MCCKGPLDKTHVKKNPAYLQHSALLYACVSRLPILYHESKSIPWIKVYTTSQRFYHESKFITWVPVNTMNPSQYQTIRFRKKSNFTVGKKQFHIWRNPISHWKKFSFTLEEIQFIIGRNPISNLKKFNITLEKIISYRKKSNII